LENAGSFYGHLEYIMTNWYIIWQFVNLVFLVYFSPFCYIVSRKIWQPYWVHIHACTYAHVYALHIKNSEERFF
jgi:hypothetical protein